MGSKFDKIAEALGMTPGRAEAVGQGAFGLGDELGAGMQGLMAKAHGEDFGPTYDKALAENRGILAKQKQEEPYLTPALEAASGMAATAPLAGFGAAAKGATALQRMLAAGKAAAPIGATFGAGVSNGNSEDRAFGALKGGAMGGVFGAGAAGLQSALSPLVRRIAQSRLQSTMGPQTIEQAFPAPAATGHELSDRAAQLEHEYLTNALKANKPLNSADIVNPAGDVLLPARTPEKFMDAAHVKAISDVLAKARQPLLSEPVPDFGANAPPADSGTLTPLTPMQKWLFERLGAPGDASTSEALAAASPVKAGSSVGSLAKTAPRRRLP